MYCSISAENSKRRPTLGYGITNIDATMNKPRYSLSKDVNMEAEGTTSLKPLTDNG
jgi:hypothetical protein